MSKYTVSLSYKVMVNSNGKVRFSREFQISIQKAIFDVLKGKLAIGQPELKTMTDTEVVVGGNYIPNWSGELKRKLDWITEHGRDAELLQAVLDKYPGLKDHPRVNELVGTFDMLSAKAQELLKDTKSKPSQATKPIAKPGPAKSLSPAELAEDREKKLLGAGSEQVQVRSKHNSLSDLVSHPSFTPPTRGSSDD